MEGTKIMTSSEILKALDEGFTLHSSNFGFWLISPIDARCTNVHNGAAKALVRKKKIVKFGERWIKLNGTSPPR